MTGTLPVPRDAATVLIARDTPEGLQIYLLRRSSRSAWLPDHFVFPGGALDAGDRSPAVTAALDGPPAGIDPAFVVAAIRETFEEAGLLFTRRAVDPATLGAARDRLLAGARDFGATLAALDTRLDGAALVPFSRWVTPPQEPRRFDARFFVARAPADQIAEADATETHDGRWSTPHAALEAYARGEIGLIFPTIAHLERIRPFRDTAALLAFARAKSIVTVEPAAIDAAARRFGLPPGLEDAW